MLLVIIESPYAGDVERNVRYLRACMRDSLMRGEAPYASHALYTQEGVLNDEVPEERLRGIRAGFAFRAVITTTVIYEDLGMSSGMKVGFEDAILKQHRIIYRRLGGEWEKKE